MPPDASLWELRDSALSAPACVVVMSVPGAAYATLENTIAAATANAVILFARLISFPLLSF